MSLAIQTGLAAFDAREGAVDIDLQCALAFARAALRTLVVMSDDMAMTVDRCLAEEQASVRLTGQEADLSGMILQDVRTVLRLHRDGAERTRALEQRIIAAATAVDLKCAND